MDFRVLGPLEVGGDEGAVELGGVKQRSVLAVLLLHANEVVSTDSLIDALWGASPPITAGKSIQVYVSRLRKALGKDRLLTRAPGYVLYVDRAELDLARFEQLVSEAGGAPPEVASEMLRDALSLWRGPPLAELSYEQFAQPEIARLEEMRIAAVEQRIETKLALGHHSELVAELESLVARHPVREHFRYQLMLALYRSDRQADALEAYRRARHDLSEELGLEPSESLRRLEAAILRQDPDLAPPQSPSPASAGVAADTPGRAVLVAPAGSDGLGPLLSVAKPLAASEPQRELIVASVVDANEVTGEAARLAQIRDQLIADGFGARAAAFSSPAAGDDLSRLTVHEPVDLLLIDTGLSPLDGLVAAVLERAPCDVGLLVRSAGPAGDGAVVVPFGAGHHDWAALQVGAWFARAAEVPLRLVGAADRRRMGRDASRLLADASLIVQRVAGIVADPVLTAPGLAGVTETATGAGLLVVGLSERWRDEGLGRPRAALASQPPAPTMFVRRGIRPGGLAPADTRTSFSWSMAASSAS